MVSTQQMLQGFDRQLEVVTTEAAALQRLQRGLEGDVARIDQELDQAWAQLAETLVPRLERDILDAVARALHLAPVAGAAVEDRLREQVQQLRNRQANLIKDPLFADREALLNEVSIRMAEVDEAIAPLQKSTAELEYEPFFEELLAYRYGTPEYAVQFFQMLFYTHWKNADLVVEQHGARMKAADFPTLVARYLDEKSALRQLEATRHGLKEKHEAVSAQVKAVQETQQGIEEAVPRMVSSVRGRVREHLMALGDDDLARLLSFAPDVDLAWRRIAGLKKKQEYLTLLANEQVRAPLNDLHQMRSKLQSDRSKLARPKNAARAWSSADFDRRFSNDRVGKWRKRRERVEQTRTHIVEFHHYDRWNPAADLLWWDVMTDGQLDGNFIPEVRARPHAYVHQTPDLDAQGAGRESFADVS